MIYRAIHLSSTYSLMHEEFNFIPKISQQNGYPRSFIENQIRQTLGKYIQKQLAFSSQDTDQATNTNTKQDSEQIIQKSNDDKIERIFMEVPFVGKSTHKFIRDIRETAKKLKPTAQIIAISKPPKAVRHFFYNKDPIRKDQQSNIVYQLNCSSCPATYIGETTRQMLRQLKEHGASHHSTPTSEEGVRRSTRIAAKARIYNIVSTPNSSIDENGDNTVSTTVNELTSSDKTSAIFRHIRETGHNFDWKNWIILSKDRHPYRLCIRESLAIAELQPSLNGTVRSVPLLVYPEGCPRKRNGMGKELKQNRKRQ